MRVHATDSREGVGWGDEHPIFRVTFWYRPRPPADVEPGEMGYFAREFKISDADVEQALEWIRHEARREERWTLHLLVRCPAGETGEILLPGIDPTR